MTPHETGPKTMGPESLPPRDAGENALRWGINALFALVLALMLLPILAPKPQPLLFLPVLSILMALFGVWHGAHGSIGRGSERPRLRLRAAVGLVLACGTILAWTWILVAAPEMLLGHRHRQAPPGTVLPAVVSATFQRKEPQLYSVVLQLREEDDHHLLVLLRRAGSRHRRPTAPIDGVVSCTAEWPVTGSRTSRRTFETYAYCSASGEIGTDNEWYFVPDELRNTVRNVFLNAPPGLPPQ